MIKEPNIIRQNIPAGSDDDLGHLPSGYGNDGGTESTTFYIPPCGIEDCDVAIYRLFNETIKWSNRSLATSEGAVDIKKPQVIFATGEKFAIAKKLRPPRDKNQVLILPAISVRRVSIEQQSDDINGRGMNQFTGDIVIKRRLAPEDTNYQNLINKYAFKNLDRSMSSNRKQGEDAYSSAKTEGALLDPELGNNIFEIFTIPQPQFFTANYEIIFWTSFTQHMNYMVETLMSSYLPQRGFRLGTDKGYWFMAQVDDSMKSADNFEDFTEEKRIIRYNFNISVKGYLLAPNGPANMVPIRRYLSAPTVIFETYEAGTGDIIRTRDKDVPPLSSDTDNRFILSDIEQDENTKIEPTSQQKFLVKKEYINPITGKKTIKYVKILQSNQKKGETSYYASDIKTLEDFMSEGNK